MSQDLAPGSAALTLVSGVSLLHPDVQVFDAMLGGWGRQQSSRNLSAGTMETSGRWCAGSRCTTASFRGLVAGASGGVDRATARGHALAHSTIRVSAAGCARSCVMSATRPTAGTVSASRGSGRIRCRSATTGTRRSTSPRSRPSRRRRALTRSEVQVLFDCRGRAVEAAARRGRKGFVTAFRDATMFKVCYAFGLRRRELVSLDVPTSAATRRPPSSASSALCFVRYGKASKGSPPQAAWRVDGDAVVGRGDRAVGERGVAVVPTDGQRSVVAIGARRPDDRAAFQRRVPPGGPPGRLAEGLTAHGLRHSYVTHLVEDGFDGLFVQQQVGHEHASTTSIYTSVSSDYRTRVLRAALDRTISDAHAAWDQRSGS